MTTKPRSRPLRFRPRAHRNGQERLRRYLQEHGLTWSDFMSLPGAERALWVARCRHANGRPPLKVREGQGAGRDLLRRFYEDPEAMAPTTEELEAIRGRRPADRKLVEEGTVERIEVGGPSRCVWRAVD